MFVLNLSGIQKILRAATFTFAIAIEKEAKGKKRQIIMVAIIIYPSKTITLVTFINKTDLCCKNYFIEVIKLTYSLL